ncbi:MAG: GTP 3',8-cyclase MoaA [Bacillota bacterium]
MEDLFQRKIDYLRISVTDRCNLRCRYCMPAGGVDLKTHEDVLTLEEIFQLVKVAVAAGFSKFRLTGGEPLVRKGLTDLIAEMSGLEGVKNITMTTNGVLLAAQAQKLKEAGLDRVNISLDTLKADRYRYITRVGDLKQVLAGIEAAFEYKLEPVKINVVAMKGFNEDEWLDFARLTLDKPLHIRFIELMPIGESDGVQEGESISIGQIKKVIAAEYALEAASIAGNGPADCFHIPGALGTLGFIGALSNHFCHQCNRIRLTADGKLRPCLHKNLEYDLKEILRQGGGQEELKAVFYQAIVNKPREHSMNKDAWGQSRIMSQIGG